MAAATIVILSLLLLIVAAATGAFVWWQAHLLRFALQVQSLLAVEKTFNERDFRRIRHHAATQLREDRPASEVEDVIDFFDTLGLLVRRRALDAEMVWHSFFYWLHGYWHAARTYFDQERVQNPRVSEDVPVLYNRLLKIESRKGVQHQVDVAEFLEAEVEQYQEEDDRAT